MEQSTKSHLSTYQRERIIHFWQEGKNISEIVRKLDVEGRKTSRATVRKWIFRWSSGRGLQDHHRCGSKSRITPMVAAYVDRKLREDDETTSVELDCTRFLLSRQPFYN